MVDIRFYHLLTRRLEDVLPDFLLKSIERKQNVVVRCADDAQVQRLDEILWVYKSEAFLPHGRIKDGSESEQPIWLTAVDDNPNQAQVLIVTDGRVLPQEHQYSLCCDLFDGQDDAAVSAARERWKHYKAQGLAVQYFQQDELGKWQNKTA